MILTAAWVVWVLCGLVSVVLDWRLILPGRHRLLYVTLPIRLVYVILSIILGPMALITSACARWQRPRR